MTVYLGADAVNEVRRIEARMANSELGMPQGETVHLRVPSLPRHVGVVCFNPDRTAFAIRLQHPFACNCFWS